MTPNTDSSKSRWPRRARNAAGCVVAVLTIGAGWTWFLVRAAERRYPALGQTIEVDGTRLRYLDVGTGPPIVLLHGAFGGAEDWTGPILEELSRTHRVLVFDRPGHGWSTACARCEGDPSAQAEVLAHAWRALGADRPLVVGFSLGATVALAAAIHERSEVGGVVTINGAIHSWNGKPNPGYVLATLPFVGAIFTHTWATPIGAWVASSSVEHAFSPNEVPKEFERSPVALAIRPSTFRANAADLRALDPFLKGQERHYAELTLPLVIVVGEGDRVASPEIHSRALAREVAGAELIAIPAAGHQMLYTHPREVVQAIEAASRRCEAGKGE